MRFASKLLLQAALLSAFCGEVTAGNAYLHPNDRVLCAGDSITAPGTFQKYVEEKLALLYPEANITFVNLGSGGKGAEFGVKSLEMNKEPGTLALFMFGVNDTGWRPTNPDEKVVAFVSELKKAAAVAQSKKYPLIFLRENHFGHGANPAPDAFEVKVTGIMDRLQEAQAAFAAEQGIPMIDVRGTYHRALEKAWAKDPAYEFTPDIIHPAPAGQAAMACEILSAFGAGLPLSSGESRGSLQIQRSKDVTLSLADAVNVIAPDGMIPVNVAVQNQSSKAEEGKLIVLVAGKKFEKNLKLKPENATKASFTLPAAELKGRYDVTPVYMAFVSKDDFAADGGLFYYSRIQPAAKTGVVMNASSFGTLHPEKTPRVCPVNDIRVQRSGETVVIEFTWNDSTPVYAQPGFKDSLGAIVDAPLNLNARDGQPCDAVEFFLDSRPVESIGRWTSNIDANPSGVMRLGIYQELVDGKPVVKFLTQPLQASEAVTLTSQGEQRYRLSVRVKAAGPCVGFSARITDNAVFKTDSTQVFLLEGYPQYRGKDPMTFVQLGEAQEGVLYRFGY